jgi:hypothetical protein
MTPEEYIPKAVRTESNRFDIEQIDPDTIRGVLKLAIASGQAVDCLKRALFYGKPLDTDKLNNALNDAFKALSETDGDVYGDAGRGVQEDSVSPRAVHASLGLLTESAEIVEKILDSLENGSSFDYENMYEELSDINWYQAIAIDDGQKNDPGRDWSLSDIMDANIRKLSSRYPEKFDTDKAYNRDLEAEREALS